MNEEHETINYSDSGSQPKKKITIIKISRLSEMILGISGSVVGIAISVQVLFLGSIMSFLTGIGELANLETRGFFALVLSVFGFIGGAISSRDSGLAGLLMILAGGGGFIAINIGYAISGPLLITAGILSLMKE
jgi:hypothetical protein